MLLQAERTKWYNSRVGAAPVGNCTTAASSQPSAPSSARRASSSGGSSRGSIVTTWYAQRGGSVRSNTIGVCICGALWGGSALSLRLGKKLTVTSPRLAGRGGGGLV